MNLFYREIWFFYSSVRYLRMHTKYDDSDDDDDDNNDVDDDDNNDVDDDDNDDNDDDIDDQRIDDHEIWLFWFYCVWENNFFTKIFDKCHENN